MIVFVILFSPFAGFHRMMSSASQSMEGMSTFEWFELAFTAATNENEKQECDVLKSCSAKPSSSVVSLSNNQNDGLLFSSSTASTAVPSRTCSKSILEPLRLRFQHSEFPENQKIPLSLDEEISHLEIDPILLNALLQISEEDVKPPANSISTRPGGVPASSPDDDKSMRSEAEKDFQDWKQTRRLIKRLSRNDSWDISESATQKRGSIYSTCSSLDNTRTTAAFTFSS